VPFYRTICRTNSRAIVQQEGEIICKGSGEILGGGPGSCIDLANRIRENDHTDFGGLEIEILDMKPAEA